MRRLRRARACVRDMAMYIIRRYVSNVGLAHAHRVLFVALNSMLQGLLDVDGGSILIDDVKLRGLHQAVEESKAVVECDCPGRVTTMLLKCAPVKQYHLGLDTLRPTCGSLFG